MHFFVKYLKFQSTFWPLPSNQIFYRQIAGYQRGAGNLSLGCCPDSLGEVSWKTRWNVMIKLYLSVDNNGNRPRYANSLFSTTIDTGLSLATELELGLSVHEYVLSFYKSNCFF